MRTDFTPLISTSNIDTQKMGQGFSKRRKRQDSARRSHMASKSQNTEWLIRKLHSSVQVLNQVHTVEDDCRSLEVSALAYHH